MLRTHGELGYRQEQRFHLELGLLKMAHAQRLLPIEQLLSEVAASGPARPAPRPVLTSPADSRRAEPPTSARSNSVSPFAADSARKAGPKAEASGLCGAGAPARERSDITGANVVIMGSAAPALAELTPESDPHSADCGATGVSPVQPGGNARRAIAEAEPLRDAVLNALGNQPMLLSLLENAEWRLEGNALIAKAAASTTMIEMSFTAEARRIASAAASGLAGSPIKMLVEPDGAPQAMPAARRSSSNGSASNGSARSRAEQDPIVQRMQKKFGAEIRTVIDYREKG